jgi:hypothetical protein
MKTPQPQEFKQINSNGADLCRFLAGSQTRLDSCFDTRSSARVDQTSCYSIFTSPIVVNHVVSLSDPSSFERLSYVLLYNLALAHHLMAMSYDASDDATPDQRTQAKNAQRKALVLYEKSHFLLSRASQNWDVSVLHALAILCNLGDLHHAMGNEEKSEYCYQNLLSTILCIIDNRAGSAARCGDVLTETLLDCFVCSVMPLLQKGSVAAAA